MKVSATSNGKSPYGGDRRSVETGEMPQSHKLTGNAAQFRATQGAAAAG